MNTVILFSLVILGAVACGSAMILFFIAGKFKVEEDPRIDAVLELLPGANCGGCGYPGCRGMSEALVGAADKGDISGLNCPPGGSTVMVGIGKYLGLEVAEAAPTTAVLRCGGSIGKAPAKFVYEGPQGCKIAHLLFSGESGCPYGCLRLGDCAVVCTFGALHMDKETGLPVVDSDRCTSCSACVKACPRGLFEIRPRGRKDRRVWVNCMNKEKGAPAKKNCQVACIGCGKCVKTCPEKIAAITLENNLAYIDPKKCIACGLCIESCPTGAILATFPAPPKKQQEQPEEEKPGKVKGRGREKVQEEVVK